MKTIAIFASGNGSNCENIIRYFRGSASVRVGLVLCNKPGAPVIERAKRLGVKTVVMPKSEFQQEERLLPLLAQEQTDLIVLAGFLLIIPQFLLKRYPIINIHPSLLPKHGGKGMYGRHVHEAVKADGDTETGMTVHWVNEVVDGGSIIAQFSTPLSPDDSVDDIAEKEHQLEMAHFPQVIEQVLQDLPENAEALMITLDF